MVFYCSYLLSELLFSLFLAGFDLREHFLLSDRFVFLTEIIKDLVSIYFKLPVADLCLRFDLGDFSYLLLKLVLHLDSLSFQLSSDL